MISDRGGLRGVEVTRFVRRACIVLLGLWLAVWCKSMKGADWERGFGHRSRELPVPRQGSSGFTRMPMATTGIAFTNHLSDAAAAKNRILENGSGVALGDVDGDGLCDVYFCRLEGSNVLYKNWGDWKFEDITASAGVACAEQMSTGAVLVDVDGDLDLDLLVTGVGVGTRLYSNNGRGVFTLEEQSGLLRRFTGTTMTLGDLDGDGDLDLYQSNYRTTSYKDRPPGVSPQAKLVNGKLVVTPEDRFSGVITDDGSSFVLVEKGEPDVLYINRGIRRFGPASWTAGAFVDETGKPLTGPPLDWGLSALFRDLNDDRAPDLYVCNDFIFSRDRMWINEGGQRFRAAPPGTLRSLSMSSTSVDVGDINRDGFDDLLVVDMLSRDPRLRQRQRPNLLVGKVTLPMGDPQYTPEVSRNTLQLNRGDGTYAEIAQLAGLAATERSWSAGFLDVDLDGYEDVLLTNGNDHDVLDADVHAEIADGSGAGSQDRHAENLLKFPRLLSTNLVYRNRGDLTFELKSTEWGFNDVGISHGMAFADLDGDGDQDVVVNNLHTAAGIYRNDSTAPRIAVRLRGAPPNSQAIGAKIEVRGGAVPRQSLTVVSGGRYLSGDAAERTFASGALTNELTIEVTWRDGRRSVVENAKGNRLYDITQEFAKETHSNPEPKPEPWFVDASAALNHRHVDNPGPGMSGPDPLLHRLTHRGPGVAVVDWNGDGWEDVVVGGGQGGWLSVQLNDGKGGFVSFTNTPVAGFAGEHRGVLGWHARGKPIELLVSRTSSTGGTNHDASVIAVQSGAVTRRPLMEESGSNGGPMALADIDGDGDLDLFVAGGVIPNRYPQASPTRILRNDAGRWHAIAENQELFADVGLVNGAVFTDLDGDGFPELALACEWGPIRIFKNSKGQFRQATTATGFGRYRGFWTGIVAGDFNRDGKMDLAVGNWGRNCRMQEVLMATEALGRMGVGAPLELIAGDLAGDGGWVALEAYRSILLGKQVPWRDLDSLSRVLPGVRERFSTYRAFGEASVEDVVGDPIRRATRLAIDTVESMVFLNEGYPNFLGKALPVEAQFAPVFGISVADADGDGAEDLWLAQNFFQTEPETSRYDAGLGLLLRGNGRGDFRAMSARESGIRVMGQQRGCAVGDFDKDGRIDWCVSQNNGSTALFRNQWARPGLRVKLSGPDGNPEGIGATVWLELAAGVGPSREVRAGGGYASQDSSVLVLATPSAPLAVVVRWPGGQTTRYPVPLGAREVECALTKKSADRP